MIINITFKIGSGTGIDISYWVYESDWDSMDWTAYLTNNINNIILQITLHNIIIWM